ncbi:hypothetical protein BD410DRAFT_898187 [Rickenella mellea]|uniref:Acyl-CoA thioesterase-like N-terminal HotDog domain-containing protein n=1 Tax=Rickenella mellea TaxID=50990 RepID=A0A4Y7Q6Z6_9AGAM|nr:hypothetical protein BD410DRAFT_898187 [Rickenella mellea]
MVALAEALRTTLRSQSNGQTLYSAEVQEPWTAAAVPQGGYVLGVIVSAALSSQAQTAHPDIIHVSAHFLRPSVLGNAEVVVRRVKVGKTLTNLDADLVQDGLLKITARLIFGVLPDLSSLRNSSEDLTLLPPSNLARRIPFITHPSQAAGLSRSHRDTFHHVPVRFATEPIYVARNAAKAAGTLKSDEASYDGTELEVPGSGTLEWASWCELYDDGVETHPDARINTAMIPFIADLLRNMPQTLPKELQPSPSWYPTITMSIEFKSRIPTSPAFARHTLGLYSSGRFLAEGRHDAYCEVWTAPSSIRDSTNGSERREDKDIEETRHDNDTKQKRWREKQICLAISHQMALTLPIEVNLRRKGAKSRL